MEDLIKNWFATLPDTVSRLNHKNVTLMDYDDRQVMEGLGPPGIFLICPYDMLNQIVNIASARGWDFLTITAHRPYKRHSDTQLVTVIGDKPLPVIFVNYAFDRYFSITDKVFIDTPYLDGICQSLSKYLDYKTPVRILNESFFSLDVFRESEQLKITYNFKVVDGPF